jgi:hypothetical protein
VGTAPVPSKLCWRSSLRCCSPSRGCSGSDCKPRFLRAS